MERINLAAKLRTKSTEDERSEEVLSRLLTNHEIQRKALEEERKREAVESRLLLNQAADVIVKFDADTKARDEEILSLKAQIGALSKENEGLRSSLAAFRSDDLELSTQPGPPISRRELRPIPASKNSPNRRPAENTLGAHVEEFTVGDALSDKEQTQKDLELAMAVQQEEIEKSRTDNRHDEESDSDSGSESDESVVRAHTAETQGLSQRLYSMVAGSTSPSMTKEEKLKEELRRVKKDFKKLAAAYTNSEQQRHLKEKQAQEWHGQGYKFYMECGALQRRVELMEHERRSMASELALTKQQLSDATSTKD
ncbi:hypothetical protein BKA70DRAFT_1352759 [Coprinopsis sp. MPI-PUGE-AT-0042]|nr:hypothetical protein BKA70DRAFT_1352759 [Coprinopsis sp. MPI-PUGE-AT-0042]